MDACRSTTKAQRTGTVVEVWDTHHPDAVPDSEGGRWAVVCAGHATVVNVPSKRDADALRPYPDEFCEECRDERAARVGTR